MKMIDGDKLERHLDYLIKRDNQFAKMCDGNDDYSRQRKYCFEVDALAYELCKSVMDYYLVEDVQPVNQWVSTKDRLPEKSDEYLAVVDGVIMEVSYDPKQKGLICVWSTCDAEGFRPLPDDAVTHWMPFPELPINE